MCTWRVAAWSELHCLNMCEGKGKQGIPNRNLHIIFNRILSTEYLKTFSFQRQKGLMRVNNGKPCLNNGWSSPCDVYQTKQCFKLVQRIRQLDHWVKEEEKYLVSEASWVISPLKCVLVHISCQKAKLLINISCILQSMIDYHEKVVTFYCKLMNTEDAVTWITCIVRMAVCKKARDNELKFHRQIDTSVRAKNVQKWITVLPQTWTPDPQITRRILFQLSYAGNHINPLFP